MAGSPITNNGIGLHFVLIVAKLLKPVQGFEKRSVTKCSVLYHGDPGSTLSVSLVTEAFLRGDGS